MMQDLVAIRAGTLPVANSDLLSADIGPAFSEHAKFWIEFTPTVPGILTAYWSKTGEADVSGNLFGNSPIGANNTLPTQISLLEGEKVNFQFSGTGGSYRLIVREVP
jgi:hypothetical protein